MGRVTHEHFVKAKKDRIFNFLTSARSAVDKGLLREAETLAGWCVMELRELQLAEEAEKKRKEDESNKVSGRGRD